MKNVQNGCGYISTCDCGDTFHHLSKMENPTCRICIKKECIEKEEGIGLEPSCTKCGKAGLTLVPISRSPFQCVCITCIKQSSDIKIPIPEEEGAMSRQDRKTIGNHAKVIAQHTKGMDKLTTAVNGVGSKLNRIIELLEKETSK